MGKKPPIRVALDLETTGLYVEQDAIVEVAAIRFQGSTVLDTLETLVAPGRSIPYRVQRLTGITPTQLLGAPPFESISQKLQNFIGDFPIVGHSIPFDASFLRRRGLARTNPLIDTFELATVLLPSLSGYNLGSVALALGVPVAPDRHRAMVDTVLAMQVFLALHERLQAVDLSVLEDLARLDAPRTWPLLSFFRQEVRERQGQDGLRAGTARGSLGERFAAQLGMDPRVLSFAVARPTSVAATIPSTLTSLAVVSPAPTTNSHVASLVQTTRAAVQAAFEQHHPLMAEVTIGTNDYSPILLPALEWLAAPAPAAPPRRLVIACATQQSARRLVETLLPRLQTELQSDLPVAYLAEKGGYLCLHRWFGTAQHRTSGELSAEQARGLAKLGLWAQQTTTGERGELTLLPQEYAVWGRIASGVERLPSADGRSGSAFDRCVYRRKGYCFSSRAAERAQAAQIVVTTHTGLLDDLSSAHSILADVGQRLLLDADLLEDECARWSGSELNHISLLELLNTVGTELPNGRYQGLLALAAPALREHGPGGLSASPTIPRSEIDAHLLAWFQTLRQSRLAADNFFRALSHLLEEAQRSPQQGSGNRGRGDTGRMYNSRGTERMDQPLRLGDQTRNFGSWMDAERSWLQLAQRLQAVIDLLQEAEKTLLGTQRSRHHLDVGGGVDDTLAGEFAVVTQRLRSLQQLGEQALALADNDMVYWLRMPPNSFQQSQQRGSTEAAGPVPEVMPVLYSQLVQTTALIKRLFLDQPVGTIFAGAAFSVDGNFAYYRGRLGLDSETCPALSVVTEHQEQTLLYIPDDVPEPNAPQYQRHLDSAITQLVEALEGQTVVLFTSHASLRSSYSTVKAALEAKNILVLGHGIDGSPRQLWQLFHDQERVVLFGTGGFWDGIDEISRVPACVFITRLPMPVLNDPPLAARAEHYSDQLHQITVPVAALRMRRALNRLAWSGPRRNAVVLFDRRVISKEYGSMILHTLPQCSMRQAGISYLPEVTLDWLTSTTPWE